MKAEEHYSLELDNAAHIYPAVRSTSLTGVHHLCVELKEKVDPGLLNDALQDSLPRYPYFRVMLKPGLLKYRLLSNPHHKLQPEPIKSPCRTFDPAIDMFRVIYGEKEIAVEFSHILTDGGGAIEFLRTLLFEYLKKKTGSDLVCPDCKSKDSEVDPVEFEDSFDRYARGSKLGMEKTHKAFHLPFENDDRFHVTRLSVGLRELVAKSKEHGISVTGFLTAVYFKTLQTIYYGHEKDKEPDSPSLLRVQVPINLRGMFPSGSLRNFTLYALPEIDLKDGPFSLEKFVEVVSTGLRSGHSKEELHDKIDRYNAAVRHPLVRSVPLVFKNMFFRRLYVHGVNRYSGVFTNMGAISFGSDIDRHIARAIAIPPPPHQLSKVNCSAMGFGEEVVLSFGNVSRSRQFEETFAVCLEENGLKLDYLPLFPGESSSASK